MRYEKTKTKRFLDKWKYAVTTAYTVVTAKNGTGTTENWRSKAVLERINQIEFFLNHSASEEWLRVGNMIYLMSLNDAFNMRMHFDEDIELIQEAVD